MKYLGGSFQVGGYSKAYADNYDRIFGKKKAKPEACTVPACGGEAGEAHVCGAPECRHECGTGCTRAVCERNR